MSDLHPLLAVCLNPLRSRSDRLDAWTQYESLRERAFMADLTTKWYEGANAGRIRLCDVPIEHRGAVYARIAHNAAERLPKPGGP
jgi:hypothetical protein